MEDARKDLQGQKYRKMLPFKGVFSIQMRNFKQHLYGKCPEGSSGTEVHEDASS